MTSKRRETEGNQTNEPEECGEFMTVDTLMPEDETGFLVLVCSLSVLTSFLFEVKGHWACVCVCVYVWLSALHHRHKELFDQSIISSQNNLVLPMFLWTVLHINHMPLKKKLIWTIKRALFCVIIIIMLFWKRKQQGCVRIWWDLFAMILAL